MKWIGKNISFVEDSKKITVIIYPEKLNWFKPMMFAWTLMWYAVGGASLWAFLTMKLTQQELVILFVFACFWIYYAQRVTRSLLWLLYGKELIKIDETSMFIKRSIRTYGKSNRYLLENIKKMTVSTPKPHSFQAAWEAAPWMVGGERIHFEYIGKNIKLGLKLNDKDAEILFKYLTKKIEEKIKKKN